VGFLFLSFGPLADSSLVSYCFVCGFYILCLPLFCWDIKGEYFNTMAFLYSVYPLSLWDKKGEFVSFWTGNVFLTGLMIFIPEWPKGEFVSILIGYILLTKSLLCNVTAFIGMPYISESSDIQSLFLWCGKSRIMTNCKCHKLHEGYFSVQGRFCTDSNSEKSDPKKPSGRCGVPVRMLIS